MPHMMEYVEQLSRTKEADSGRILALEAALRAVEKCCPCKFNNELEWCRTCACMSEAYEDRPCSWDGHDVVRAALDEGAS